MALKPTPKERIIEAINDDNALTALHLAEVMTLGINEHDKIVPGFPTQLVAAFATFHHAYKENLPLSPEVTTQAEKLVSWLKHLEENFEGSTEGHILRAKLLRYAEYFDGNSARSIIGQTQQRIELTTEAQEGLVYAPASVPDEPWRAYFAQREGWDQDNIAIVTTLKALYDVAHDPHADKSLLDRLEQGFARQEIEKRRQDIAAQRDEWEEYDTPPHGSGKRGR